MESETMTEKVRLIGLFCNKNNIRTKVSNLFDSFSYIMKIYSFSIEDKNKKYQDYLLTFYLPDSQYQSLRDLGEKPITLNKKEKVYYTINGLVSYIGLPPEECKNVKIDFNEIGENVLLLKTDKGHDIHNLIFIRQYNRIANYVKKESNDEQSQ